MNSNNSINYKYIIAKENLFWGDHRILDIIEEEKQDQLCNLELLEWLSGLYWGEGVAVKYASKMFEISTTKKTKQEWYKVYQEEFKHQTMISSWLLERNLIPLPMNNLLTHCSKLIDEINPEIDNFKLVSIVETTQLYFEELLHFMIKRRLNSIKDRDLQAILYVILKDEASHIAVGRKEIKDRNKTPPSIAQILRTHENKIFPKFLAKGILSDQEIEGIKELSRTIVNEFIEDGIENKDVYSPVPILKEFLKLPNYNCFATSPHRHDSLHIYPKKEDDVVYDELIFSKRFEGFNGIVHGGIIATAFDEIMFFSVTLLANIISLTKKIENIEFLRPIRVGSRYRIESRITNHSDQLFKTESKIIEIKTGKVCASCIGEFFAPKLEVAQYLLGDLAEHSVVRSRLISEEALL